MEFLSQPNIVVAIIEVAIGLYLLTVAADKFVDGAVDVAKTAKLSPVVVGAVIVGFGTSAPELLVSGVAAADDDLALGVGNVVGSNVANLSLVLGAAALVMPIAVGRGILRREAPLSVGAVTLFALFAISGFEVWEGVVLLVALVVALSWVIIGGNAEDFEVEEGGGGPLGGAIRTTMIGLLGTLGGAYLMVWGATAIAKEAGLSGGFVGFTLVAIGTSLPELVTAVAAARKGETELIIGNLLGSNVFNSLAVGGVIAILGAGPIGDELMQRYGLITMVIVAGVAWIFMMTRGRFTRVESATLLSAYVFAIILLSEGSLGESIRDVIESIA